MRALLIGDVHGNLHALEAVLAEAEGRYETVVCDGDLALFGGHPAECVDRVRGFGDRLGIVHGNTDRYIAGDAPGPWSAGDRAEAMAWYRERLGEERVAWLRSLPTTLDLPQHDALLVHAVPRNDEDVVLPDTPDEEVAPQLAGVTARTVLCGHVHLQYRRTVGAVEIINPGAVGMPFDGDRRAAWGLLDGPHVELYRTAYDTDAAIAAVAEIPAPVSEIAARRLRTARSS